MSLDFYDIADVEDGFGATKGRRRPHRGLDIPRPGGTPIPAWRAGTVVISEYHAGLGWVVETDSGGVFPGYCHMIRQGLPVGTVVKLGDTIGYVGTTGSESNGNHLHTTAGTRKGAVFGESMAHLQDPWPLIQAAQSQPANAEEEDEEMNIGMFRKIGSIYHVIIGNPVSGFKLKYTVGSGSYNNAKAEQFKTGSFTEEDQSVIDRFEESLDAVRQGK